MGSGGFSVTTTVAILLLAVVVAAVSVACAIHPTPSGSGPAYVNSQNGQSLLSNPLLACSGCEALVGMLTQALQYPNPQLLGQRVQEQDGSGRMREVEYVESVAYVHALLDILCSSSSLSQLRLTRSWLGVPTYGPDPLPSYQRRSDGRVDPSLKQACEAMVANQKRASLAPTLRQVAAEHPPEVAVALVCSRILIACRHKASATAMLTAVLEEALVRAPAVLLRLLPLLVMAVLVLAVLAPPNWTPADPGREALGEEVVPIRSEGAGRASARGHQTGRRRRM